TTGFSGNYPVGSGGRFPTLTGAGGAFAFINGDTLAGNVTLTITGNLNEDGTNALNQWLEKAPGSFTITIMPDGSTERVLAGSASAGLIVFNGADRVKIDGRWAGSGRYLRLRNRNAAVATIVFQNDAKRD